MSLAPKELIDAMVAAGFQDLDDNGMWFVPAVAAADVAWAAVEAARQEAEAKYAPLVQIAAVIQPHLQDPVARHDLRVALASLRDDPPTAPSLDELVITAHDHEHVATYSLRRDDPPTESEKP